MFTAYSSIEKNINFFVFIGNAYDLYAWCMHAMWDVQE